MAVFRHDMCEIDLSAIRHNVGVMKERLRPQTKLLAVVKADAYGHGAVPVAKAALAAGADMLAVAIVEEGAALRRAGIDCPILVLGGIEPQAAHAVVEEDLTQAVFDEKTIRALQAAGERLGRAAKVHLKLDTGMNRIGVRSEEDVRRLVRLIDGMEFVELTGCFTHMATADEPEDGGATLEQIRWFEALCEVIRAEHPAPIVRHAGNTACIFCYPQAHFDMVRGGIALYGYPPVPQVQGLRPAMRWTTRAVMVKTLQPGERIGYGGAYTVEKPMRVMTLPVGYADGYRRAIGGRGFVLVRGRRAKVLGRVCMDQMMVDVSDIPGAQAGDEAVLLGAQGEDCITAQDMAAWLETIPYEVLCSPSARVPRVYREQEE